MDCLLLQTVPLLTPTLCTLDWFAKTPKPKNHPNGKTAKSLEIAQYLPYILYFEVLLSKIAE